MIISTILQLFLICIAMLHRRASFISFDLIIVSQQVESRPMLLMLVLGSAPMRFPEWLHVSRGLLDPLLILACRQKVATCRRKHHSQKHQHCKATRCTHEAVSNKAHTVCHPTRRFHKSERPGART